VDSKNTLKYDVSKNKTTIFHTLEQSKNQADN
jgi:hypothetical protein